MSTHTLIVGLTFLICLMAAAILFSTLVKNSFLRENLLSAALAVCGSLILGVGGITIVFWYAYDFVADITVWQYLLPLLSTLLIAGSFFIKIPYIVPLAAFLAAAASVFGGGLSIIFLPQIPLFFNQLITAIALWLFAVGFTALSGLNPLPQTEGITISIGFILLYLFGLAPFIIGAAAAGLLGALLIAYLYSASQPIGIASAPLLGFILGWLGLLSYGEYLLPCFIIFAMFYLLELLVCTARRITLLPRYRDFAYNSVSVQSFTGGFPAQAVIRVIWSTNILLIILGMFQINGANPYSIPVFAALITAWQLYRMTNWRNESQTLKETNRELVKDIKSSFNKLFSSDDNTDNKTDKH